MNNDMIFTENTVNPSTDFLSNTTKLWEQTAQQAEQIGIRTVFARFGIVLDREFGALSLMKLPFLAFVGGKIGNGEQWMSWIHIDDCVNMLLFAIENDKIVGPMNVTSPYPKRNKQFSKTLGKTVTRPTLLSVPTPIINIILGEMSSLLTKGQFVYPDKALQHDFVFKFSHLDDALKNIFKK